MECIQDLDTSGARAAETFTHQGVRYLVVPQLALDVPGQPALMTVGNSDCDALVFRWQGDQYGGQFVRHASLPVPGGEDAEFFTIGERAFLATASLKTGAGPYELNVFSTVFELDNGVFTRFQDFPTFAAKQWVHFAMGQRHFLAMAQGVVMDGVAPRHPAKSTIYEWNGERFVEFQQITSAWGYNWAFFEHAGGCFLAHADHIEKSCILRWNGERFEPFQELDGKTGRAFQFFRADGQAWLAFACLHADTVLYRWDGQRFALHQTLSGPGGREFTWLDDAAGGQLVLVNFLHGTREEPVTALQSATYRFQGGQLAKASEFATLGGTDAVAFEEQGDTYLVVSHSLSAEVRFRTPTKVYRLGQAGQPGKSQPLAAGPRRQP